MKSCFKNGDPTCSHTLWIEQQCTVLQQINVKNYPSSILGRGTQTHNLWSPRTRLLPIYLRKVFDSGVITLLWNVLMRLATLLKFRPLIILQFRVRIPITIKEKSIGRDSATHLSLNLCYIKFIPFLFYRKAIRKFFKQLKCFNFSTAYLLKYLLILSVVMELGWERHNKNLFPLRQLI